MSITAYLLTADAELLNTCNQVLAEVGVTPQNGSDREAAIELLEKTRFDLVVLDFALAGVDELVRFLRRGANRASVVFGIVGGEVTLKHAFNVGANFALERPLDKERATTSFRAAANAILRDRRQHFRYTLEGQATIIDSEAKLHQGEISNVSEGGLLVQLCERLAHATKVTVRFNLPPARTVEAKGEVIWSDADTGTGIRFVFMSSASKHDLENWIVEQLVSEHKPKPQIWKPEAAKA